MTSWRSADPVGTLSVGSGSNIFFPTSCPSMLSPTFQSWMWGDWKRPWSRRESWDLGGIITDSSGEASWRTGLDQFSPCAVGSNFYGLGDKEDLASKSPRGPSEFSHEIWLTPQTCPNCLSPSLNGKLRKCLSFPDEVRGSLCGAVEPLPQVLGRPTFTEPSTSPSLGL